MYFNQTQQNTLDFQTIGHFQSGVKQSQSWSLFCAFPCAWHWEHVFPRLVRVACRFSRAWYGLLVGFPALGTVCMSVFPRLVRVACRFSSSWYGLHVGFPVVGTSCMVSATATAACFTFEFSMVYCVVHVCSD